MNDTNGNPLEIAAVVVFKVTDPARALFDVDNYESFVEIQSETALRHVAAKYPYDNFQDCLLYTSQTFLTQYCAQGLVLDFHQPHTEEVLTWLTKK